MYQKRNVKIGVLNNLSTDYQQLTKILSICNKSIIEDIDVIEFDNYNDLYDAFLNQIVDVIYLNTLQKMKL